MSPLAINGRFRRQVFTGVQRYATGAVAALEQHLGAGGVTVLEPPDGGGVRTRVWELWQLSADAVAATGSRTTLNLGNWGPLRGLDTAAVVIHDVAPLEAPEGFSLSYRTLTTAWMQALRRSRAQVVTVSTRSRRSLEGLLGRPVAVAPNGVDAAAAEERRRRGMPWLRAQIFDGRPFALLVGGHDHRKNAAFAIELLPELRARDLSLVITHRPGSRTLRATELVGQADGLHLVASPNDEQLWALYGNAEVVLHPSTLEGFGLPLLEGAAVGTPFLTTDVGAAEDLAVDGRQILPLDPIAWARAVDVLREERSAWSAASRERAAEFTWKRTAAALLQVVEEHRAR